MTIKLEKDLNRAIFMILDQLEKVAEKHEIPEEDIFLEAINRINHAALQVMIMGE